MAKAEWPQCEAQRTRGRGRCSHPAKWSQWVFVFQGKTWEETCGEAKPDRPRNPFWVDVCGLHSWMGPTITTKERH